MKHAERFEETKDMLTRLRARLPGSRIAARIGGQGLGARAARAGLWGMIDLGAGNVLRLLGNLAMTRLLAPEAFGLMAMVTVVHIALAMFTDLGINQSVVRSARGDDPRFLRVAWTVQVLRSLGVAVLVVAAAGALAALAPRLAPQGSVYADPALPALIAVSSLVIVLKGLESTNLWLADRRLQLGRIAFVSFAGQTAGLMAMVGFAVLSPTVWSLLWGGLTGAAITTVLTHRVFDGSSMTFVWDPDIGAELWSFGRNILGSSILGFFANNTDRLILGALLGVRDFGFYVIALTWVLLFVSVVEKLAGQIAFAALSEATRDRPEEVGKIYGRLSRTIDGICLISFLVCLFGGPVLIDFLYPDEYAVSAGFVPFLAVMILARRFQLLNRLLLSRGDSRSLLDVTAIRAAATLVLMPLGHLVLGIAGALLASGVAQICGAPLLIWRARHVLGSAAWWEVAWIGLILGVVAAVYSGRIVG